MKRILCLLLMVWSATAWGQMEFAPVGAKWGMSYWSFALPNLYYAEMVVEKDTIFAGKAAKKISSTIDYGTSASTAHQYIHQSGDSIFVFNGDEFIYLYNFSLEVGDSINFIDYAMTYYIDSIAIEMINDVPLKMQFASAICPDNGFVEEIMILEKIGPFSHSGNFLLQHSCLLDGAGFAFRCYSDPDFPQYLSPYLQEGADCFFTTGIANTINEKSQIEIFPNPITNFFELNFADDLIQKNLTIELFNIEGQRIKTQIKPKGIKSLGWLSNDLVQGIYFIKIHHPEGLLQTLKMVKQ